MSTQWINHQHETMGASSTKRKNAITWATTMIDTIFIHWLKLWKVRNEARHGRYYKTQQEAAKKQAFIEL
jgi:hypothetical protein